MDLAALLPGQTLAEAELVVSQQAAEAYLTAVGDSSRVYLESRLVPPMALATLALAAALRSLDLPAGTVHTGQELTFAKLVKLGVRLRYSAMVEQNAVRRGLRFLRLQTRVTHQGQVVVHAATSLAIAGGH